MKNTILKRGSVAVAVLGIGALLSACGGGGGGSGSGFTTTSAYVQDDASNFPNVTVGIYSISLANTGDGNTCVLFSSSTPVYINLASLSGIAQYISTTACPSDSAYNRLDIVLSNTVSVITDTYNPAMCTLTSYNPNASSSVTLPNTVNCGSGSSCTLDMTGNIGALSGTNSYVDIDFDLKDSSYAITSGTNCQFSFATMPITMENENKPSNVMLRLRGYVSNLSTTAFNIVKDDNSYTVVYSSLTSSVSSLLQSASSNSLKVAVVCSSFTNNICTASIIARTVGGVYEGYSNNSLTLLREDNASDTISLFNPVIYPLSMTWSSFTVGSSYLLDVNICDLSNCTSSVYFTGNIMLEDDND
ncbi:hypothetical protein HY04AAS1_1581 [Hydrogenobaculum sp. Y04AAS1]|uniref:DUF4382 domain-containing protein n=1 Tax=Hydrogenobaculum sp. (strain Y04AAS1) TaxID=380749 RepID=UPI00015BCEEB|nr:hypothetical protein HY04AAS1_1581 [Hydrogenobaculum sp. Y04AAS1]HCT67140.1 hypothetical protein [Hydrogenobaculum sp.]